MLLKNVYMTKDLEVKHTIKNPYGIGNTGKKIADFISKIKLDKKSFTKRMTIKFR